MDQTYSLQFINNDEIQCLENNITLTNNKIIVTYMSVMLLFEMGCRIKVYLFLLF